jgi:hypothetical protein
LSRVELFHPFFIAENSPEAIFHYEKEKALGDLPALLLTSVAALRELGFCPIAASGLNVKN